MEVSTGIYVSKYVAAMTNGACIKNDATGLMNISTNELILRDYIKQSLGTTSTQTDCKTIYDTDYAYYMYNKYIEKTSKPDEFIPPSKTPPLMKEEYPPLPYEDESEISDNEEEETSTPPPEEETSTPPPEEETSTPPPEEETSTPPPQEETPTSDNKPVGGDDTVVADKEAVPVLVGEIVNPLAENSAKCCIIV